MENITHAKNYIDSAFKDISNLEIKASAAGVIFGIQNALKEAYAILEKMESEAKPDANS
jgi:hypothetical protein